MVIVVFVNKPPLRPSVMVVGIEDENELAQLFSRLIELSGFNCISFTGHQRLSTTLATVLKVIA